jgi:hypothetical protein
MAINFNLSDLSSAQKRAGTGRRYNTPYTYSLLSATPQARQGAIDEADAAYKQSVLNQEKDQFNTQLAQNASQYNTSLAQTAQQFNENQAMQQAIADEQAAQAKTASYVQGGQTALTLAALVGKNNLIAGGKAVADMVLPSTMTGTRAALGIAPKVAEAAAPAATDAVGIAGPTAEVAGATGSAAGDTLGVSTGEVVGAAGKTAANVVGKVAVPLAIIAAANMARNAWGQPEKKWYGEDSKSGSAKFFDDPGMGLGSNVVDAVFGSDSEIARIPSQVGEQFSHFAGGPIGKAFDLDFKGALNELTYAPETAAQSFGIDKGTSEAINATLNSPGYAYSQWANEGNSQPAVNLLTAPDPITGSLSTAVSNMGLGAAGDVAAAVINPVGATINNTVTAIQDNDWGNAAANVATGGLWGALSGGCVIVTACTDRHAPEVEIAREYRDKYLSPDQLRGYYMIAEKVVPRIERSNRLKKFVKRILVDNLIEYGRFALGKTTKKPGIASRIITRSFLALCEATGRTRKTFTRSNGEVF